jgi:DNA processing protein
MGAGVRRAGAAVGDPRAWWWGWSGIDGVGIRRLRALEERFGSLEAAWGAPVTAWRQVPGLGEATVALLATRRERQQPFPPPCPRRTLLPDDPAFPAGLAALERPPLLLQWQGRGSLWPVLHRRHAVAVVGTRSPSLHGLSWARRLGLCLARAGWPVISGLAEGIDAEAHQGCLEARGAPVGVIATPLDRVYPRHHQALQAAVGRQGLLLSEHPPGTPVRRGHFAARNRLVVAMASAVVVVECPEGSGALHAARQAWDAGVPLWVVPADTDRRSAAGSNALLARGATPLVDPDDLIRSLGRGPLWRCGDPGAGPGAGGGGSALLAALGAGATLDELAERLHRPLPQLALELLELERQGVVLAAPGACWRPRQTAPRGPSSSPP